MNDSMIFVVGSFVAACSVKVKRLPTAGESLRAESFILQPGGKGFNCAVAAHRLEVQVDGLLAVGSDFFADFAREAVSDAGLPPTMLVRFAGKTGAGVGFVDQHGENCIAVCPAANDLLSPTDIYSVERTISRARLVVAQFEIRDAPIVAAFSAAKRAGAETVLNPSPYRAIASDLLSITDILIVNQTEAAAIAADLGLGEAIDFAGHDILRWSPLAQSLFEKGVKTLVVTLGARGVAAWSSTENCLFQNAFPVEAIDTIGAGDAFLGGLLAARAGGADLAESLRWGAACGALVSRRPGLLDAFPTRAELIAFLDECLTLEKAIA